MRVNWYRLLGAALCVASTVLTVSVIFLIVGCAEPQLKPGVYKIKLTRTVTNDWCYLDGKKVYGWWKVRGGKHYQCISLKAPFPFDGTLVHENRHMDLWAHGLDPHFH